MSSKQESCCYLGNCRVFAEVKVTAEVTVVADYLWQDVGLAGVTELGVL